jgi:hypothetical protein
VETDGRFHLQIHPGADVRRPVRDEDAPMTTTDYLMDSALVLLVLLQVRERELTTRALVRPLIILGAVVAEYLHSIPTAGNDLVLVAAFALTGGLLGLASGRTVFMRLGAGGRVLARSGWASGTFWVLGMGSRVAFVWWITHSGHASIARFSATHAITSGEAWTVALLAMAVAEVLTRTAIMATRRYRLATDGVPELA